MQFKHLFDFILAGALLYGCFITWYTAIKQASNDPSMTKDTE